MHTTVHIPFHLCISTHSATSPFTSIFKEFRSYLVVISIATFMKFAHLNNPSSTVVSVWSVPHRLRYLNVWFLVEGAPWRYYGTVRRWSLAGGSSSQDWSLPPSLLPTDQSLPLFFFISDSHSDWAEMTSQYSSDVHSPDVWEGKGRGRACAQATGRPQCPLMRAISGAETLWEIRPLLLLGRWILNNFG